MLRKLFVIGLFICVGAIHHSWSQSNVFQWKNSEILIVNDGMSKQTYKWKEGVLWLTKAKPLSSSMTDTFPIPIPDRTAQQAPVSYSQKSYYVEATDRVSGYYQLDLHTVYANYEIKRSLRVYDNSSGVEWSLQVKGNGSLFESLDISNRELIEDAHLLSTNVPFYFSMPFSNPHFTTKVVSFQEATDHHSNIVNIREELPYRKLQYYKGSVLIAQDNHTSDVHLVVKMSPLQEAQSAYMGFDFSTDFSGIKVHSPGIVTSENDSEWQEAYRVFSVMYAGSESAALDAYKKYELNTHKYIPEKDNTFTMNTWGDRNRDSRINEKFILNELEVAAQLGITHYQIDDGWQRGLSSNSATKTNSKLWDSWEKSDWEVNSSRFPNGLTKITRKAKSLGIGLGLWFNPSKSDDYANWERDKDIMLGLHQQHGVSWIKIDGLRIGNKKSENNVKKMFQMTQKQADNLQFNIDVTAGKRGGYFFFNHLGNIFLENRYTDWGNYYPHLTLRNVWILAKYVPIQRFQIEWLNKWRNKHKYPTDDLLKPYDIPFDYQFAITMMGQPLAWMEATGLPNEAFSVVKLINLWKKERSEMQMGVVHPLGEMPNGYHFTGFVSYTKNKTYVLLFRENTSQNIATFKLPLGEVKNKKFVKIAGEGNFINAKNTDFEVSFSAPFQFLWGFFE
ncbi:alpha-galactosidase [Capnocytophaga cynodegmi]|uniref:alpha-galactosidase n=1 Tax=Capnocytophaga cynodegmi TaxID=28189 RepID=UPI001ACAF65F|nr:alpha-galactosidase [Capnocytophaga cynodegmi]GIM54506.1 hypothetical protein CAPN005_11530 [Capnocytophaga cynodegmi]